MFSVLAGLFSGCRFPLCLRGSLSFANISNKWQDSLLVILHLKIGSFMVKYSRYGVKKHPICFS